MAWTSAHKWIIRHSEDENPDLNQLKSILPEDIEDFFTESGSSVLHFSALCTSSSILQLLLEILPNFVIDIRNKSGETALHWASRNGNNEGVQMLLENGANPNIKDEFGFSSLHHAVDSGKLEIVDILLSFGVDVEVKDNQGISPLHLACLESKENIIISLCKLGRAKCDEILPILINNSTVKTIVEYSNQLSMNHQGETLLHLAIKYNSLPLAEMCDTACYYVRNKNGELPLDLLAPKTSAALKKYLKDLT